MVKIKAECIDEAVTALKNFNADELEEYTREVFNRARSYDNLSSSEAFDKAIKDVNNEALQSFFEDATIAANNTSKFEKNSSKIKNGKANMRSIVTKRFTNLGDNVASAQWAARNRLARKAFDSLEPEEIDFLANPDNQFLIADAMDGKIVDNVTAHKIAKIFHDYIPYRNGELVTSNAMKFSEMNKDRNFRYIHNAEKIMSGGQSYINAVRSGEKYDVTQSKKLWIEKIKKHFDMKGTFERTDAMDIDGNIDWVKGDQILSDIYDNITTGKSEIFTRSHVSNDREAVKRKSRMFFKPKSMRDFVEYNKMYGQGDLYSAWISDIHGSGAKTGMAEMFGDSPYSMYGDLREATQKSEHAKSEFWWDNTDHYFTSVMGTDKAAKSASAANFGANLRTLTSMARLPMIAIQSISDIGYIAAFAQRMGINYWHAYFNQLKHIFDRFPTDERMRIAKLYKLSVDSHMGYVGRWLDAANSNQILNKVSTKYFRLS